MMALAPTPTPQQHSQQRPELRYDNTMLRIKMTPPSMLCVLCSGKMLISAPVRGEGEGQ